MDQTGLSYISISKYPYKISIFFVKFIIYIFNYIVFFNRIVIVTSKLFESGIIDFSNLNCEKGLVVKGRMNPAYCNSKLANTYFGIELAKRTKDNGINVYMVCPGFTYTGLFRNVKRSWFHYIIFSPVALLFLRTANQVIIFYTFFFIYNMSHKILICNI